MICLKKIRKQNNKLHLNKDMISNINKMKAIKMDMIKTFKLMKIK